MPIKNKNSEMKELIDKVNKTENAYVVFTKCSHTCSVILITAW